jgi:hypothetical protein
MSSHRPLPGLPGATKLGTISKKRKLGGIETGGMAASTTLDLIKRQKAVLGYGTDQGLYGHPHPHASLITWKQVVASDPASLTPKLTVASSSNEAIR